MQCGNYRRITVLNVIFKIFSRILQKTLNNYAEELLGLYNSDFGQTEARLYHIIVMRQSMEKCYQNNIDLNILFVDFQQVFDSINRT